MTVPTEVFPLLFPCPSAEACYQGVALMAYAEQSPYDDSWGLCSAPEPKRPSAFSRLGGGAPPMAELPAARRSPASARAKPKALGIPTAHLLAKR